MQPAVALAYHSHSDLIFGAVYLAMFGVLGAIGIVSWYFSKNVRVSDREPQAELTDSGPRDDRNLRAAKPSAETMRDRLLAAFEMFELGVDMMAANLRRRHPQASSEEIERRIDAWLLERPGAEEGNGPGVPVSLERFVERHPARAARPRSYPPSAKYTTKASDASSMSGWT